MIVFAVFGDFSAVTDNDDFKQRGCQSGAEPASGHLF